jgi:hypothetical protein
MFQRASNSKERDRELSLLMTVTPVDIKSEYQEKIREISVLWKRLSVLIKITVFQGMKKCSL